MTERSARSAPWSGSGDGVWLSMTDAGSVGTARRAATSLATEVGLHTNRTADLAIVATELATNVVRHAVEGSVLVRPLRRGGRAGVQMVAVDKGPGLRDLEQSTRDGHSTYGSLGIGLGAVIRKATEFDAHSLVGMGTVMAATVFPAGSAPADEGISGLTRPMAGETVCGDGYTVRARGDRTELMLCDGLGHGPLAAFAAQAAVAAFHDAPDGPLAVLEHLHRSLRRTRGAVVTVVSLDPNTAIARYAGLGNVFGAISDGSRRHIMAPQPGIAGDGHHAAIRVVEVPLPGGAVVVLHSDGLRDAWSLTTYPGLAAHGAVLVAATLLRDFGVRRDDAAVLVAKVAR
jgi:anti-sigma regulatory factor (Ser/Thr protein kinase)